MKRRDFFSVLGGAAAWPILARADDKAGEVEDLRGAFAKQNAVRRDLERQAPVFLWDR